MSDGYPVYVAVRRSDGSTEQVRVGTAQRQGDGFSLKLGELTIGSAPVRSEAPARRSSAPAASGGGGDGMLLPNYGRSKGQPVYGASMQDLEFYANGARRTLADPSKQRWHDKERALLAALEAEMARQRGESGDDQGVGYGGSSGGGYDGGEPPPHSDDDAPF